MSPIPPLRRANNGQVTEGAGGAFFLLSEVSTPNEQTFGAAVPESTWSATALTCQTANITFDAALAAERIIVECYAQFVLGPGFASASGRGFARCYRNGPVSQSDIWVRRDRSRVENVAAAAFPTDVQFATAGDIITFSGRVPVIVGAAGVYNWAMQWAWYDSGLAAADRLVIRDQAVRIWQEIGD